MRRPFYTRPVLRDRERDRRSSTARRALDEAAIVCAVCNHPITTVADRIDVAGAHEHLFVNPAGFQYRIGCYRTAPGCTHVGPPEAAFSWFPGFDWQLAACARCRAHLGWVYRNAGEEFHGLITDRLKIA